MNILVTGCGGYFGSELSRFLRFYGHRVFGLDAQPIDKNLGYFEDYETKAILDLKAPPWIVDAVFHLAGASQITDDLPSSHYQLHNVDTSAHLRELYPVTPIYMASTTAIYDEIGQTIHHHPYTRSKEQAEQFANVIYRMGTIVGANYAGRINGLVDRMIESAFTKNEIICAEGSKYRPLAGINYLCMMWMKNAQHGNLSKRG